MAGIDFTQVQTDIRRLQPDLMALPFVLLQPYVAEKAIRLLSGIQGVDVEQELQRKGGLLKPYDAANVAIGNEVAKIREFELRPRTIYYALQDNIQNYREKQIIGATYPNNQDKRHPLEGTIANTIIRTFNEDLLFAFWNAEYDKTDQSPSGAFDGIHKLIDNYIASGDISAANGNMYATGTIPPTDTSTEPSSLEKIVAFVAAAHPMLRQDGLLYMSDAIYQELVKSYDKTFPSRDIDIAQVAAYINARANARIRIVPVNEYGGDRLILAAPQLFDLGLNTETDLNFIDLRQDNTDPNKWLFWIQAEAGARIRGLHQKVLLVNDRTASSISFQGEY